MPCNKVELLNASYRKKHEYIWFRDRDLNGFYVIQDFQDWLGLGIPLGQPFSLDFKFQTFLQNYISVFIL